MTQSLIEMTLGHKSPELRLWEIAAIDWVLERGGSSVTSLAFLATMPYFAPPFPWLRIRELLECEDKTLQGVHRIYNQAIESEYSATPDLTSVPNKGIGIELNLMSLFKSIRPNNQFSVFEWESFTRLLLLDEATDKLLRTWSIDSSVLDGSPDNKAGCHSKRGFDDTSPPWAASELFSAQDEIAGWIDAANAWTTKSGTGRLTASAFAATMEHRTSYWRSILHQLYWRHDRVAPRLRLVDQTARAYSTGRPWTQYRGIDNSIDRSAIEGAFLKALLSDEAFVIPIEQAGLSCEAIHDGVARVRQASEIIARYGDIW